MDWSAKDTIVGIATPPGAGGIAVLRISGRFALEAGRRLFQAKQAAGGATIKSHTLYHGNFVHPSSGDKLDSGLFAYMQAPRSYTGEDTVELHGHGGVQLPRSLMTAALELAQGEGSLAGNIRQAEPGEFTFRAFLHQKLNLMQAEAVDELVQSKNRLAQKLALRRFDSVWAAEVGRLLEGLRALLAHFEADLDFPEEGLRTMTKPQRLQELATIRETLQGWLEAAKWQRMAQEPLVLSLAGPANVGKSTLFNCLLHQERALVDAEPGTTRDFLDASLEIGGLPLRLVDTAGFRRVARDCVEAKGLERSKQWLEAADLCIWLDDPDTLDKPRDRQEVGMELKVVNKIDLLDPQAIDAIRQNYPERLLISAKQGDGVDVLRETIQHWCDEKAAMAEAAGLAVNDRQKQAIFRADGHLQRGESLYKQGGGDELIAEELWGASRALEELTGKSLGPEVIEAIFKNFCIGK